MLSILGGMEKMFERIFGWISSLFEGELEVEVDQFSFDFLVCQAVADGLVRGSNLPARTCYKMKVRR